MNDSALAGVRALLVAIFPLLLPALGVAQMPSPADKFETDQHARMASAWTELSNFAAQKGAKSTAATALDEARACGFSGSGLDALRARVEATEGDAPSPEVERKEKDVRERVRRILDDLMKRSGSDQAKSEAYFLEAVRVAPHDKKLRASFRGKVSAAVDGGDKGNARKWLARARVYDKEGFAEGKYLPAEANLAKKDLLLVGCEGHPARAYVSLPPEWGATSKTPYPVIFAFDGAGCRFEARALELKKAAAKTRYVVVTPVSFSNANELKIEDYPDYDPELVKKLTPLMARDERIDWDMAGADALYAALRERFRLEEKAYLTGYSGGGFPVHKWIRSRTESVAAACLVSANYGGERADDRRAPEDGGPPIYFITGENDAAKERIFPQTDQALETLRNAGFKDVDHRRLKGRQHETFPDLTIEFFEASRKKASK